MLASSMRWQQVSPAISRTRRKRVMSYGGYQPPGGYPPPPGNPPGYPPPGYPPPGYPQPGGYQPGGYGAAPAPAYASIGKRFGAWFIDALIGGLAALPGLVMIFIAAGMI